MPDTRPRSGFSKTVLLDQLDAELGGFGLCASDDEIVVAEGSPVTQEELEAAIAAHVAVPVPTLEDRRNEIIDSSPDWQGAMRALLAEGLLS